MPDNRLTVIMPVRNQAPYISAAVTSVLEQSFSCFDLVVIDDASTDDTVNILKASQDKRLQVIVNERNLGLAASLNRALEGVSSQYIARMDGDDLCSPERLAKQVEFMDARPEISISGSFVRRFSAKGSYVLRYPQGAECLRSYVLFGNPLAHPSVIIRREDILKSGFKYDESCGAGQDYELWSRCLRKLNADNIPEPLVDWRESTSSVTSSNFSQSNKQALAILSGELQRLGICLSVQDLNFHRQVGNGSGMRSIDELIKAEAWLHKIENENSRTNAYPDRGLSEAAAFLWFRICLNSSGMGLNVLNKYFRSSFQHAYRPTPSELSTFLLNGFIRMRRDPAGRISE